MSDTAKYVFPKRRYPPGGVKQNSGAFSSCQAGEVPFSRDCTGKKGNRSQAGGWRTRGRQQLTPSRQVSSLGKGSLKPNQEGKRAKCPIIRPRYANTRWTETAVLSCHRLSMVETVKMKTERSFHCRRKPTAQHRGLSVKLEATEHIFFQGSKKFSKTYGCQ